MLIIFLKCWRNNVYNIVFDMSWTPDVMQFEKVLPMGGLRPMTSANSSDLLRTCLHAASSLLC